MTAQGKCTYCGTPLYQAGHPSVIADPFAQRTRDHIIPAMMGVHALNPDNIVPVCRGCNDLKGNYPFEVFDWFRRHAKRLPQGQRRLALHQLCYNLIRIGFTTVLAEAQSHTPVPFDPPHRPRGHYTARDLRKHQEARI